MNMNNNNNNNNMNRNSMPPKQGGPLLQQPGGGGGPKHRKDKTKVFGQDPSVPAPPGPGGPGNPQMGRNSSNNSNGPKMGNRNSNGPKIQINGPPKNNRNHADSVDSMNDKTNDDIYGNYSQRNTIAGKPGPQLNKAQSFQPGMNRPGMGPGNNLGPNRNAHFKGTASTGNLMPNNGAPGGHFKNTASTGQLGMAGAKHRKDKTKIFGQDPTVPAPPGAGGVNKGPKGPGGKGPNMISQQKNTSPSQLTPQQQAQMNQINKQNQMYRQQQMLRQQNQSVRNVNGHQRQVQRNSPRGAWGPTHPYWKMYQQRMQMMRQQQMRGGGGPQGMNAAMRNQYYQKWQQYYQRLMQNPQGQLQQMVMQQQQMIANLKRQLQERDKHYHKTIQTTINFKDMEINELREQISKLDKENEIIGELQMQNFKMKQELNNLRGDHQSNVFDNLLDNMTSRQMSKSKVAWPGGPPQGIAGAAGGNKYPSPPTSDTKAAGAKDPRAALNAMLKSKSATPSERLLTKKTEEEKKLDKKDDGKFAKYAKMKKIGMPMVSIVNRMRMDGMSAQEIEEYTGEKVGGDDSDSKPKKGPKVNVSGEKYDKYRRMQKLKMPMKTIVNRMKLDGCSQAEMDSFSGKETSSQSAAAKKKSKLDEMRQLAATMGLNPMSEVLPSKVAKMKRIHWDIVELSALRKTFWWDINQNMSFPQHIDLGGKFELDFQVRQRKPRLVSNKAKIMGGLDAIGGGSGGSKRKKGDRITWIGAKRDQSIQIALKRIGLPNEVIYDAIVDINEEIMSLDLLEVVWDIAPTSDEQALAEAKVDEIGDDMEFVGVSEMFHIEMSTIPEVKQQLSKWLFARTFREVYMDRLGQVNTMQKCANSIRHSLALQTYFRLVLSMGNLMNHGTLKGIAYGFKLDSVNKLLPGIKDYGGKKDLAMFLYQFAYNSFPQTRTIFDELPEQLKKATRLEITSIEQSIVKMADEFTAIDLFIRRLNDDFHPGDTEAFREYMTEFQDRQSSDMMNLKVKIQNATQICRQVAKFYSIELEEDKPEHLFIVTSSFLEILGNAKRQLLKLEKERIKAQKKAAAKRAKEKKKQQRNAGMSVAERISSNKQKAIDEEEKGNLLFLDIKNAANDFAARQEQMNAKLENTLKEKLDLSKGKISASAQKDAIKRRVSANVMADGDGNGGLDMDEIKRLRAMNLGPQPGGNSLMVPGMGMDDMGGPPPDDDQKMMINMSEIPEDDNMNDNDYGGLMQPALDNNNDASMPQGPTDIVQIKFSNDNHEDIQQEQQQQNQQQQTQPNVDGWDDDDF